MFNRSHRCALPWIQSKIRTERGIHDALESLEFGGKLGMISVTSQGTDPPNDPRNATIFEAFSRLEEKPSNFCKTPFKRNSLPFACDENLCCGDTVLTALHYVTRIRLRLNRVSIRAMTPPAAVLAFIFLFKFICWNSFSPPLTSQRSIESIKADHGHGQVNLSFQSPSGKSKSTVKQKS